MNASSGCIVSPVTHQTECISGLISFDIVELGVRYRVDGLVREEEVAPRMLA